MSNVVDMKGKGINQTVKIDMNDLKDVQCTCGNNCFIGVNMFKIIPLLYSNSGKEELIAVNCVRCTSCREVYKAEQLLNIEVSVKQ
jgi:hypothetical protein